MGGLRGKGAKLGCLGTYEFVAYLQHCSWNGVRQAGGWHYEGKEVRGRYTQEGLSVALFFFFFLGQRSFQKMVTSSFVVPSLTNPHLHCIQVALGSFWEYECVMSKEQDNSITPVKSHEKKQLLPSSPAWLCSPPSAFLIRMLQSCHKYKLIRHTLKTKFQISNRCSLNSSDPFHLRVSYSFWDQDVGYLDCRVGVETGLTYLG